MDEKIFAPILAAAMKHVDVDAVAKNMAPKIAVELEKQVMAALRNDFDWGDLVFDVVNDAKVKAALKARLEAAFKV